ncbi:MAG: YdcF family protein [Marivibrio sp.]|uniref:YdcF family protein n=1 Tax=Marivibrio sp. TaxID=2039719 RepID=UPI0032EFC9E1
MGAPRFSPRERRPWRRRLLATLLGAGALAWALGFLVYAAALPDEVADPDRPTDAIVVLTGGSQRLETGLELLSRGAADQLFVSGVYRGVDVAELLRIAQQEPGRHECCIHIDYKAGDTIGNARETAAWMEGRGFVSLRLVTAAYHMPRSLMEFRTAMPDTVIVPHPVFPPNVKQSAWFRNPGTAALFAGEYTKYLLARVRIALEALIGAAKSRAEPEAAR